VADIDHNGLACFVEMIETHSIFLFSEKVLFSYFIESITICSNLF